MANETISTANGADDHKKHLLLSAFVMATPGHLSAGQWKHPRNKTADYSKLGFWTSLAQMLDDAGFHCIFFADTLGPYDVYKGPGNVGPALSSAAQFPVNDPLYAIPAMAAVTKNIVFGITASTTYEAPYALARKFSTVDHLTDGRVAWNIVTSYLESAARNFGLSGQADSTERYRVAEEFMDVVYKLWEGSWSDDAAIRDVERGVFAVPGKVRRIDHKGENFSVAGPHICEPSPQRTPFLFQAGTSKTGVEFAAKHAEAVFVNGESTQKVAATVASIRKTARDLGRDPSMVKIMAGVTIIIDSTDEKAQQKRDEFIKYGDLEGALALLGGWTGIDIGIYPDDQDFLLVKHPALQSMAKRCAKPDPETHELRCTKAHIAEFLLLGGAFPTIVGSPQTIADQLEKWVDEVDVDGFNLAHVVSPGSYEDIIEFLLPELKRRGLLPGKPGQARTAREVFGGNARVSSDHPAYQFRFAATEDTEAASKHDSAHFYGDCFEAGFTSFGGMGLGGWSTGTSEVENAQQGQI
ncbi:xenobiotic compound monooxygenase like protein [Zymoseptoria brevis]|uniref:Xenobiotic compound monooxygenase like protein n=1 Tax=Zymoseptoria brevis TaxID=1047168 RepID=A0A0F4GC89_9PEZI|nr:xenobiotic compound monooxygenase like protein [Zymoseptoria brevis]